MTRRTSVLGHISGKNKRFHQKNISQTSATTETLAEARQKIEVEQKCVEKRKRRDNSSVWRENLSILDNNDDKDEGSNIVDEKIDKIIVADMYHQIQHLKSKVYYKPYNEQNSINILHKKVDILEEVMDAEHEDGL